MSDLSVNDEVEELTKGTMRNMRMLWCELPQVCFMTTSSSSLHVASNVGVLLGRLNVINLELFIQMAILIDFHLLVKIYFSSYSSTAIKIKDGCHNFHQESTLKLLAKITPALQAMSD